jgi:hypothetical protein
MSTAVFTLQRLYTLPTICVSLDAGFSLCRGCTLYPQFLFPLMPVLMVKSGLDPHMIVKLKDDLNCRFCLFISVIWIDSPQIVYLRVGIYLHLVKLA